MSHSHLTKACSRGRLFLRNNLDYFPLPLFLPSLGQTRRELKHGGGLCLSPPSFSPPPPLQAYSTVPRRILAMATALRGAGSIRPCFADRARTTSSSRARKAFRPGSPVALQCLPLHASRPFILSHFGTTPSAGLRHRRSRDQCFPQLCHHGHLLHRRTADQR